MAFEYFEIIQLSTVLYIGICVYLLNSSRKILLGDSLLPWFYLLYILELIKYFLLNCPQFRIFTNLTWIFLQLVQVKEPSLLTLWMEGKLSRRHDPSRHKESLT